MAGVASLAAVGWASCALLLAVWTLQSRTAAAVPGRPINATALDALALQQLAALVQQGATRSFAGSVTAGPDAAQPAVAHSPPQGQRLRRVKPSPRVPGQVIFKDRQSSVPRTAWMSTHEALHSTLDPSLAEELEPYLYDFDYVASPYESLASADSHLWDPELRAAGSLHCERTMPGCPVNPYLPYLYYVDDEYMNGWALDGFHGAGLRIGIGPNAAASSDRQRYQYTYTPYTQRILFAPTASLFFPYLLSIYAGDIYVAETDPFLLSVTRAARAGIVEDYTYFSTSYMYYWFATTGVAASAVFAATARARGVVGAALKLRNFDASLVTLSRDDYNERNRIALLNSLAFIGASGGGYIFSLPAQRNAFVGQNARTQLPYYAYDYSGALNPLPLQPAAG